MKTLRESDGRLRGSSGARFGAGLVIGLLITQLVRSRMRSRTSGAPETGGSDASFLRSQASDRPRNRWVRKAGGMVRGLLSFRPLEAARRDHRLDELEERVLSAFLADQILGERAVDIAALGSGVVELTGTVNTDEEAAYAVRTALALPGVLTVVNRLATLDTGQAVGADLRGDEIPGEVAVHAIPEGRVVGMGRRRQGTQTDPDQPDDSGKLREKALDAADRDSWEDEGFLASSGQFGRDTIEPTPVNFDESELDNQDPGHKW